MSCRGCGRDWDGSAVYCPTCSARAYMTIAPCVESAEPTKIDRIIALLEDIKRLLQARQT